ncbi:MAG: hypothetical protein L6R40_001279 [Gallowayella cf. fulva]|nr:MAG: hypothetical protein L6R40_001279 [Xanthomendoza cf. fulva]
MLCLLETIMTSSSKRVPIPRNGVDYRGKVVLAPMVRSGELPSRLLALKYGADLVWGPETIDKSMIGTTKRINPVSATIDYTRTPSNSARNPGSAVKESCIYRLHPGQEGKRLIFQIGTSSPSTAVEAAKLVAPHVAGIDVNAGCPKPFSTSGGMGAALLQTPDHLAAILSALVREVGQVFDIGISVKIRLLETAESTEALVKKLCATGITGLTVHCRTTPMRPRERALRDQLRMIADTCRNKGVACVMNGDVKNKDEALQLMHEFGADGAMLATAAEANPSSFRTRKEGGLLPWQEVAQEYIKIALDVDNKWGNTKFTMGQLVPGKSDVYKLVTRAKNYVEVCEALGLADLYVQAGEVDERLGLRHGHDASAIGKAKSKSKVVQAASGRPSVERSMDAENRRLPSERGVGTFAWVV